MVIMTMMMYLIIFLFAFLIALRPKSVEINKTDINPVVVDGLYFPLYCSSMTTGCLW